MALWHLRWMAIHHLQSWQKFFQPCWRSMYFRLVLSLRVSKTLKSCWITLQKPSDWATSQVKFKKDFIIHTAFSGLSHCQLHYSIWLTTGLTLPAMWPFTGIIHSKLKILILCCSKPVRFSFIRGTRDVLKNAHAVLLQLQVNGDGCCEAPKMTKRAMKAT